MRARLGIAPVALALLTAACRQDMHDQPRLEPLEQSGFFADAKAARRPPAGTVARGMLEGDPAFFAGRTPAGEPVAALPVETSLDLLERGRERYGIFCSPCHGMLGDGQGMIVLRGLTQPSSFHTDRLRAAPPGYLFDVITTGFGRMPSYASQVPPADRWAIIAYLRALQLSQHARLEHLSPADRASLTASSGRPAPSRPSRLEAGREARP